MRIVVLSVRKVRKRRICVSFVICCLSLPSDVYRHGPVFKASAAINVAFI